MSDTPTGPIPSAPDGAPAAPPPSSRRRDVAVLVAASLLWVPPALDLTPFDLPVPLWPFHLALALLGLWLLVGVLRARPGAAARRAAGLGECVHRSWLAGVLLGGATLIHLYAGGGVFFFGWEVILIPATLLGLCWGPLTLFENHAARRPPGRARDLVAGLLAGWGAFLVLCAGWAQAVYVREVLKHGDPGKVFAITQDTVQWLTVDPLWTARHYAWAVIPTAVVVLARLRGAAAPRQAAVGLAAAGAALSIFPSRIPAVVFGLAALGSGFPLASWGAAWLASRRSTTPGPGLDPGPGDEVRTAVAWRLGVVGAALALVALGARAVQHEQRLRINEADTRALLPGIRSALSDPDPVPAELARLRDAIDALAARLGAAGEEDPAAGLQRLEREAQALAEAADARARRLAQMGQELGRHQRGQRVDPALEGWCLHPVRGALDPECQELARQLEGARAASAVLAEEAGAAGYRAGLVARMVHAQDPALRGLVAPARLALPPDLERGRVVLSTPRGEARWEVAPVDAETWLVSGWSPELWLDPVQPAPPGLSLRLTVRRRGPAAGQVEAVEVLLPDAPPRPVEVPLVPPPALSAASEQVDVFEVPVTAHRLDAPGLTLWYGAANSPYPDLVLKVRDRRGLPGAGSYTLTENPQPRLFPLPRGALEAVHCWYDGGREETTAADPLLAAFYPRGPGRGLVARSGGGEVWQLLELEWETAAGRGPR